MEDEFKNTVISLYKQKKWKDILHLDINSDGDKSVTRLLWVWPSIQNFDFLKKIIEENHLKGLISVGCGCGLLEWMFKEYSKLEVVGYEINEEWWTSKYSIPSFINLVYTNNNDIIKLSSKYALLFCYFNNNAAFRKYIQNYDGNLVFIIGPEEGWGIHTDPQPFKPGFPNNDWILIDYQQVKNTKDYITAYIRN